MKKSVKKLSAVAFLALIIAVPLAQVPAAYSAELTGSEKAISFLRAVVGLDMARYNVTLEGGHTDYPYELGGLSEESLNFELFADESQLSAIFLIRNGTLCYCSFRVINGTILYAQPQPADALATAKNVLQRYQTYSNAPYLQQMRNMLDAITEHKSTTVTADNVTLNIKVTESVDSSTNITSFNTNFKWIDSPNGIENAWKVVGFSFHNETFRAFGDMWDFYSIGSSSLNVSEEEAISMAMELAKNYTLRVYVNGSLVDVSFNIRTDMIDTHLSLQARTPLTLYPFWYVQFYFDRDYYSATGIIVGIWADTGEVSYCRATGYAGGGGDPSSEPSDVPSSSSTQPDTSPSNSPTDSSSTTPLPEQSPPENDTASITEDTTTPPTSTYVAAAAVAVSIPIAIAAIALKKRRK